MNDEKYMMRAIELSENSFKRLDMPIGCVIACDDEVVAESENYALTNKNFTEHAEVVALLKTSKMLGTTDLSRCTLYTSMEPCAMCALLIREYRIKKVVFSLSSPDMGGYSKYQILTDTNLNEKYPHHFGDVPEIIDGILKDKASEVWNRRSELKNSGVKHRLDKY
jgi:tRNA(adenine34) deaminase